MASASDTARSTPLAKKKADTGVSEGTKAPPTPPCCKPKRRGRPPKIDQQQVLLIARDVFLAQGILATTQEVARRAGISEGTLFHRFKTKEGLFRAAMELPAEEVPRRFIEAVERVSELGVDEALGELSCVLLKLGKIAVPLMMMSWSNPAQCPQGIKDPNHLRYREFVRKLAGYFESQMDLGLVRRMDAEVLARCFLGSLFHYSMAKTWSAGDTSWLPSEDSFKRGVVDLVLNGALPREANQSATPDPAPRKPPSNEGRRKSTHST